MDMMRRSNVPIAGATATVTSLTLLFPRLNRGWSSSFPLMNRGWTGLSVQSLQRLVSSYTNVHSVIYDSGSVPRRASSLLVGPQRGTKP